MGTSVRRRSGGSGPGRGWSGCHADRCVLRRHHTGITACCTHPSPLSDAGFLTEELEATCAALEAAGVGFKKRPQDGKMRGLAFAVDPDGYWIEIIQRGLSL